ncbi:uncharacterized protein LOC132303004 [Cornus florida]|uniref:uncharacterized protein LOC132303004 n=1 Tax=Cornus florida TaxID=4283 RepID=UPI0028A1FD05|nr:uncharacterized protein LOC132303004 [Cornus florida]
MISQIAHIQLPIALQQRRDLFAPPAMLSLGGFPPPSPPCNTIPHSPISQSLLFPRKTYQTHFSFCSNRVTQFGFCDVPGQTRTGLCANAVKGRRRGGNSLLEMDAVGDDGEDEDDNHDDDDDDKEVFVPLRNMKEWLENKPSGFGEGKAYDTSIEDKLLDEMEQSRQAQLANIEKLKDNPENPNSKKEEKQKASEVVPSGLRVRLVNLPKKKKIHRDLQLAFKGVPGIVNIIPAVSGSKKTRDPICKGVAFVDFKSEDEANRFVQAFSGQSITFGKIQKQIRCEMMNPNSPVHANEQSPDGTFNVPQLPILSLDSGSDFDVDDPSVDSLKETASDEYEGADDDHLSVHWEGDSLESIDSFSSSEPESGDNMEPRAESATNSPTSKQQQKTRAKEKKLVAKRKVEKTPKWNIPGSVHRLKIKEKAVLTGVFSKYGVKAASAVKEQS